MTLVVSVVVFEPSSQLTSAAPSPPVLSLTCLLDDSASRVASRARPSHRPWPPLSPPVAARLAARLTACPWCATWQVDTLSSLLLVLGTLGTGVGLSILEATSDEANEGEILETPDDQ